MLIKALLLPLGLIILFGGGLVAVSKPLNLRATVIILGLGIAVLLVGIASGWPKWMALVALGLFFLALLAKRFKS